MRDAWIWVFRFLISDWIVLIGKYTLGLEFMFCWSGFESVMYLNKVWIIDWGCVKPCC